MAAIREVERNGSRFYKVDGHTTVLYYLVERISSGIRQNRTQRTLEALKAAKHADPANPLFDCLEATALWRTGDKRKAVDLVMSARKKGPLRVYGSSSVEPVAWQWPEIEIIVRTATEMIDDNPSNKRQLMSALTIADMIVSSEPPHPVRIMLGLSARHSAARKLRALAERAGDTATLQICDQLVVEGRMFRNAWSRMLASREPSAESDRALTLQRALREGGHHHNAAALLELDEQAEWAGACRSKYLVKGLAEQIVAGARKRNEVDAGK